MCADKYQPVKKFTLIWCVYWYILTAWHHISASRMFRLFYYYYSVLLQRGGPLNTLLASYWLFFSVKYVHLLQT